MERYGERTLYRFLHARLTPDSTASFASRPSTDSPSVGARPRHRALIAPPRVGDARRARYDPGEYASEHDPAPVILAVPTAARAETATAAVARTDAQITACCVDATVTRSTLQIVTDTAQRHSATVTV